MEKPDVDHIEGLSPAISIEQKSTSHNPRSTVGTITEIYDYLRLLFSRVGVPHCPIHQIPLAAQTISQMVDLILNRKEEERLILLAPVIQERKGEHIQIIERLRAEGFIRARINGEIIELDQAPKLALRKQHTIEVVVDRFRVRDDLRLRLSESFETALRLSEGTALIVPMDSDSKSPEQLFSSRHACNKCGYSLNELEPRLFSFNNPAGACPECDGLGVIQYFDPTKVVQNTELSLPGGAIKGWDRRNIYYFQMINSIASHYKFNVDTPFKELSNTFPYNISASYFLRPFSNKLKYFDRLKEKRILDSMTHAAKNNLVFHLWWHPHNFGINLENNMSFLLGIMQHYKKLENKYVCKYITFRNSIGI
jgi:excinuclease ABC subunit A